MYEIKVINLKNGFSEGVQGFKVDRSSVLGNHAGKGFPREVAIKKYREWLWKCIQSGPNRVTSELMLIHQAVHEGPVELGCWCKPKECHGDVIKNAILWKIEKEKK